MPGCKMGDTVMVIKDDIDPENTGRTGEIIGNDVCGCGKPLWVVKPAHTWYACLFGGEVSLAVGYHDDALMPLRPGADDGSTDTVRPRETVQS